MTIDEFCARHGKDPRNAGEVTRQWGVEQIDRLLQTLEAQQDPWIGGAVIAADALNGDGLRDQIPTELRDAFAKLMRERADSYSEMRKILADKIRDTDGSFLSLHDPQVRGFISKLKGQIGENIFQENAGAVAHLAESGSQEGWDVMVDKGDVHEYVQVKLYSDPAKVVERMREVQEKCDRLAGWNGEAIDHVDFAVPESIADRVRELAGGYPELDGMRVLSIPISAMQAGDIVKEGLANVGPGEFAHFFDELLGGILAAGSLHALANAFLWYKGNKEFSAAFADATASTALSTSSIGLGLMAETLFDSVVVAGPLGITSRILLSRMARARWSFADYLDASTTELRRLTADLNRDSRPATC